MEEDHKYGTNHKGNIRVKTIFAVIFALTLEAAFVFSATVMRQEDLPIEATWQKTQISVQNPLPGHESHQTAIVLP